MVARLGLCHGRIRWDLPASGPVVVRVLVSSCVMRLLEILSLLRASMQRSAIRNINDLDGGCETGNSSYQLMLIEMPAAGRSGGSGEVEWYLWCRNREVVLDGWANAPWGQWRRAVAALDPEPLDVVVLPDQDQVDVFPWVEHHRAWLERVPADHDSSGVDAQRCLEGKAGSDDDQSAQAEEAEGQDAYPKRRRNKDD
jgi:hypothetical protein